MCTSKAGEIAALVWRALPIRFNQLDLDEFQIMPNHLHAILEIRDLPELPRVTLGQVVGAFKSEVTVQYCAGVRTAGWPAFDRSLWQRGFYDRIIRNDNEYQRILDYIHGNPGRWQLDRLNPEPKGIDPFDGCLDKT